MALKTGATGLYVDDNDNAHGVLVIGPHFEVKSPGNKDNGEALPPARVPVKGFVRVRLFDEDGDSWTDHVREDRIVPANASSDVTKEQG